MPLLPPLSEFSELLTLPPGGVMALPPALGSLTLFCGFWNELGGGADDASAFAPAALLLFLDLNRKAMAGTGRAKAEVHYRIWTTARGGAIADG